MYGPDELDLVRPDDVGAACAADIVPVDHDGLQHHRKRQRRDGEKRAAQPQRQVAHAEPDDARHDAADDQSGSAAASGRTCRRRRWNMRPSRRTPPSRSSHSRYSRRECSRPSPARRTAAPCSRRRIDSRCSQTARRQEHNGRHGHRNQQEIPGLHDRQSYRPRRPCGRNANVSSSRPNPTAGAQDGP